MIQKFGNEGRTEYVHVVGKGLANVSPVELKREEHEADPGADAFVDLDQRAISQQMFERKTSHWKANLADDLLLLFGVPFEVWVVAVRAFVVDYRGIVLV